ncbi:MAG: hypothetical protein ACJA0N_000630 [Pseudohongiellaceae bacterium]
MDIKVKAQLSDIVPLINFIVAVGVDSHAELTEQIDSFHRLAEAAVTLRVLLQKKGKQAPPLDISVPEVECATSSRL